jgi:hypothetical protein
MSQFPLNAIAPCSWTPEESQVESCEHQNNANIHGQPFPESVSEEHEIYGDYDACHRQHVKQDGYLSAHSRHDFSLNVVTSARHPGTATPRLNLALMCALLRIRMPLPVSFEEVSMKCSAPRALAILSALLVLGVITFAARPDSGYHLLNTYKFDAAPGSTTEYFDYITVDSAARRVYLSRGTAVQVMDADTGALVGYVSGFKRQHGVALAPELQSRLH